MGYTFASAPSPNFTPNASVRRRYGMARVVQGITIHHWGVTGQRFESVVSYLRRDGGTSSAHYVAEAGRVTQLVGDSDAAWHAGSAIGNARTIGIECRPEASDDDYETVAALIRDLRAQHGDVPLYPHRHWKATACPGTWDLDRLDRLARQAPPAPPPAPIEMETDMPYIVRCRVAGHAHQGTWWIVLPRAGQPPLASALGKADTTEGIPAINYTTTDGYDRWRSTVAGA